MAASIVVGLVLCLLLTSQKTDSCHTEAPDTGDTVTSTTMASPTATSHISQSCESFQSISHLCPPYLDYQNTSLEYFRFYESNIIDREDTLSANFSAVSDGNCNCRNRSFVFFCHLVLPQCNESMPLDVMLPCQQYCIEFIDRCFVNSSSLPDLSWIAAQNLSCDKLPESECWNGSTPFTNCTDQLTTTVAMTATRSRITDPSTVTSPPFSPSTSALVTDVSNSIAPPTTIDTTSAEEKTTITSQQNPNLSQTQTAIIAASCAVAALVIVAATVLFWRWYRNNPKRKNPTGQGQQESKEADSQCTPEVVENVLYVSADALRHCDSKMAASCKEVDSPANLYTQVKKKS